VRLCMKIVTKSRTFREKEFQLIVKLINKADTTSGTVESDKTQGQQCKRHYMKLTKLVMLWNHTKKIRAAEFKEPLTAGSSSKHSVKTHGTLKLGREQG
jgi:hypothetical protein